MSKVRVIGLDGATFSIIDHLAAGGRLPNFSRLMDKGRRATLLSTAPPVTWPAWASFYTGTNPGKTGAADLFRFRPGTYKLEPMNAGNLHGRPIWSLAGDAGRRVCVYNVPVTYPAAPVNGILISGLDAPSFNQHAIYPLEFKEKLLSAVPDFQINYHNDAKYLVNRHPDPVREWIRRLKAFLDMEIRTINYLMGLEDWDLFVSVIRSPDIFQHTLWRDAEKAISGEELSAEEHLRAEAVFECYEAIDRQLGETGSGWGVDGNLVIMSDHGFGRLRGSVCLNRVLAEAGLLKFHPLSERKRTREFLRKKLQARMSHQTRQKIKRFLGKERPDEGWSTYVDVLVSDIDWEHTRVASIGGFGCLFVNIKGRDPLGTVSSEEEMEKVIAKAEAAISGLRDPWDGEPMVTRFYRKEELFHGPLAAAMPDLVVNFRDWSYCPVIGTATELDGGPIVRPPVQDWKQLAHTGTHRREGILILAGAAGMEGAEPDQADMVDVAPTIADLLGLPRVEEWDGRSLLKEPVEGNEAQPDEDKPAADGAPPASRPEDLPAYSEEDEDEVRKRLGDLGYL
ncbi:MAG: alkaline phosphatase family protein [Thermoleophilia bacterium]|nr:alkaline phosphatase family protein [Thermoleophilia bacterium]